MKIVIIDNYDSFTYNLSHLVKELGAEVTVLRNDQFELAELEPFDKIILSPGPGIPSEAGLLLDVIRSYAGRKPILGVCLGHQAIGEVFGARLENLSDVFHGIATPCRLVGHASKRDDNTSLVGHASKRDNTTSLVGHASKRDDNTSLVGHASKRDDNTSLVGHASKRDDTTSLVGHASKRDDTTAATLGSVAYYDPLFAGLPQEITVGRYHSWVVSRENFPDCLEITAESPEGQIMALRHRHQDVRGIQFHPESVLTPDGRTILKNWLDL